MTKPRVLTADEVHAFSRDGVVVLRGFYDLEDQIAPVQRGIYVIIGQVLQQHDLHFDRPSFTPAKFDAGFQELLKTDRRLGGVVYDAVKQLPPFLRLVSFDGHDALFKQLRPGALPGVAGGGYGIRIDNPNEDRYRAFWHQEYPAQLRSLDGIVLWSPLVPVTPDLGPVEFCAGSHKLGPLPVLTKPDSGEERSGAYALRLLNEQTLVSSFPRIAPLTNPGDLVIVDFLTLHASGFNRSARSRWSMQFRYFNYSEPVGRTHGWKGSFAAGVDFRSVHPELCAD